MGTSVQGTTPQIFALFVRQKRIDLNDSYSNELEASVIMRRKKNGVKKNNNRGKLHIINSIYFPVDFDSKGGVYAE